MTKNVTSPANPPRRLGPATAGALVVANMIGAGVFTTSGFALADLGRVDLVLLAWAVGGAIALCGALSYGALARFWPESGGEYLLLSRSFHPLAGFLAGWVSLLAGFTAPIAVAALGLVAYLAPEGSAAREALGGAGPKLLGSLAIALAALLHGLRLGPGVLVQNLVVAVKLVLIAGFLLAGAWLLPRGAETPAHALEGAGGLELGAFAVALVWISFSYSGWNATSYVTGELRDPEHNVHRSLWRPTLLVTALYLALNAVFLLAAPASELAGRAEVGAVAAEALGGAPLRRGVGLLVALALFSSVSAMVMAGPRVYARMARDGLFPRAFEIDPRRGVPTLAIAAQALGAIAVVWIGELAQLLGYVGFTLGLSSAATVCGLFVLRAREGAARVPAPGYPIVPAVYVVATLGAAGFLVVRAPAEAAIGLVTVLSGVPVWWMLERRRAAAGDVTPRA